MTSVEIFVRTPTQTGLLYTTNEKRIRAASTTIDNALDGRPYTPVKKVEIDGAAPAAFRFVLNCIDEHEKTKRRPGDKLRIEAHDEPIAKTTAIYEAIEALGIKPSQPHIENHIIGYIAHNTLTPHELYTPAEADALQRAVEPYPQLRHAIEEKMINELLPRKAFEDETRADIKADLAIGKGGRRFVPGRNGVDKSQDMRIKGEMSP